MGIWKVLLFILGCVCMLRRVLCCLPGYTQTLQAGGRVLCVDDDECQNELDVCGEHAQCYNTHGSFYCTCQRGFRNIARVYFTVLDGQCLDINECLEDRHICGANALCVNTIGSYACSCQPGFTSSNGITGCTDIDECEQVGMDGQDLCGNHGSCRNTNGTYWCDCHSGYSNYGNDRTPCSELKCDQFNPSSVPAQSTGSLATILSLMSSSCEAMSNSSSERSDGEALLENLFLATSELLSPGPLGTGDDITGLLGVVEHSMKLIGPQLRGNLTRMETTETEAQLAVHRGMTPPTGPVHLTNENATLDTDWRTAVGNGTYPGFALAALLTYKNLEKSTNRSFEQLPRLQKDRVAPSYQIFSKVVSAVVSNPSTQHLDNPVVLTLRHLEEQAESDHLTHTCAYWKQDGGGSWSSEGCDKMSSNATHTICRCDHLSSFAVLVALYPIEKPETTCSFESGVLEQGYIYNMQDSGSPGHPFELVLLTRLGLGVSLVCLALSILTFQFCRSIKGTRTTIHLHLCICLFLGNLIFLAGISQTEPKGGCRFVAGALHFLFLAAFLWMLLEGVQLYRMVVTVFNTAIRPLHLYLVGYGTPLVVVAISAGSRPYGYGTTQHCWLSTEQGLVWSFLGPVCLVITFNVFFFLITAWRLGQKFSSLNPDLSRLHNIRAFTVTAVAQLLVLGLTWVIGAFLFQGSSTVLVYIFTILNSLQGALIFLMHCLLSKQVREEYASLLACVCMQQRKRHSDYSSTSPSSQSRGSKRHTGESQI